MQVRRQSETASSKGYAIAALTEAPQNILEKIVWHKEQEVAQMYATEPIDSIKAKRGASPSSNVIKSKKLKTLSSRKERSSVLAYPPPRAILMVG